MNKMRISLDNFFQWFNLLQKDRVYQILFWLECFILIAVIGFIMASFMTAPVLSISDGGRISIKQEKREEIAVVPADFFVSVKAAPVTKTGPVFAKLTLTGTGMIKGVYKASIEDDQGNSYYVREGERIKGMLVKKVGEREVLLVDKSGNQQILRLER